MKTVHCFEVHDFIRRAIFGLTVPQQYVCIGLETFTNPLHVTFADHSSSDRTFECSHVLLGYKPVLIALAKMNAPSNIDEVTMLFHQGDFDSENWRNSSLGKTLPAKLRLKKILTLDAADIYQAITGEHRFINLFHQTLNRQKLGLKKSRAGNVDLPDALHDMVRISYAIPRKIAVIIISDGQRVNVFPTDLHGQITSGVYMSSLRIGGKAQQQVEQHRRIVLAEVDCQMFESVYALGGNHMKEMSDPSHFDLTNDKTEAFRIPLPRGVLRYYELNVNAVADAGIHRVFSYNIVNEKIIARGSTLAHIHQYYCQWRKDNNFAFELLIRRK